MANYLASPRYSVGDIVFDMNGGYETEDAAEIKRLDALVPMWIKRVDEPEEPKKDAEPAAEEDAVKPAPKTRKAGTNASGK